ncbi:PaaX family transcriptional regulator C-terminal domain-containing protein [Neomegalonema perideroedes]|uniref:PaaX family transcriptional regulator C-terminal domain-containing protein n=1 Tax=Neomegalonema perideroedes TaxID=217219 RepID=UPI000477AC37|nr:PaaX family transcriptional regulator C-terminal domain-containing protein [Neomegalonema perideroedes]
MSPHTPRSPRIERLMQGLPLTAASFIVTVYGDVVVTRGEVLWMGSLIGVCKRVGISETLVRTAASRLAAAGRLEGERKGRRSFYRLAPAARTEFSGAARLLYAAEIEPTRWLVIHAPGLSEEEARRQRMARMGGEVWIRPDRGGPPPRDALALRAEAISDPAALAGFWDLDALQSGYAAMLARFAPLAGEIGRKPGLEPSEALAARLLLVQVYRGVLLRDPCLPTAALPSGWLGAEARKLFRRLYLALSPAADAEIGRSLEGREGLLPQTTPGSETRLAALA